MSAGEFPPKVVRAIFQVRDNESCFYCGQGLSWEDRGVGWSMHHRRPRGMGGTRETWVGQPANGVTLCGSGTTGCHGWVETNRGTAVEYGLIVPRNGVDRAVDVPVRRGDGSWWWLTNHCSAVAIEETVPF